MAIDAHWITRDPRLPLIFSRDHFTSPQKTHQPRVVQNVYCINTEANSVCYHAASWLRRSSWQSLQGSGGDTVRFIHKHARTDNHSNHERHFNNRSLWTLWFTMAFLEVKMLSRSQHTYPMSLQDRDVTFVALINLEGFESAGIAPLSEFADGWDAVGCE